MTYDEAIESTVSRAEAEKEIARHSADLAEFIAECGDHQTYSGQVLLDWLGY